MSDCHGSVGFGRRTFLIRGAGAAAGAAMAPEGFALPGALPVADSLQRGLAAWLSTAGRLRCASDDEWVWRANRHGCELGEFLSGIRPPAVRQLRAAGDRLTFELSDGGRVAVRLISAAAI